MGPTASRVDFATEVERIRGDFPALHQKVNDKPLVYLDSAATAHKPQAVIDAIVHFYGADNSNVHRGVHQLSERATSSYEGARFAATRFLNAAATEEIIFTSGATAAINLVAATWGRKNVKAGDEIIVSAMEHHSNIVPWQMLCEEKGAILKVAPIDDRGELILDAYAALLGPRTRLVAMSHVSNALGTINPARVIVELAHEHGIAVLLDGAQATPHLKVDVQDLGCDFYALSAHKMYGPTGIGVLYGKKALLDAMPPWQGGGDMIEAVSFEKTTWNELPYKFEAGTPNIAGAIGLGAAIEYLEELDFESLARHEDELLSYATEALSAIEGVRLIGTAPHKLGVLSFVMEGVHAHDIGTIMAHEGVAIRVGHHCAEPVMERFGVAATARASLALYNTRDEIDAFIQGVRKVREIFGR
jgi:cysteine desulfurase/selenocysteine lyase